MVLLARAAGLRLLGLFVLFVHFDFFSKAPSANFPAVAECGGGKWDPQNHW